FLRLEMRNFAFGPLDERIEALAFGLGAALFRGDLPVDEVALQRKDVEDGLVDVLAVRRDLIRGNGKERLSFLDPLPVFHVELFDEPLLWNEDLGRSDRGRQIADDRFLPGVLRDGQEEQDQRDDGCEKPGQDLARYRLKQHDRAPVLMLALEI